jgi:hypothetical protein
VVRIPGTCATSVCCCSLVDEEILMRCKLLDDFKK